MRISKIGITRVYNIRDYESLRIYFEVELEDGDNPNTIILNVHKEIWDIEKTIAKFEKVIRLFGDLKEMVEGAKYRSRWSQYSDLFDEYRKKTEKIREDRLKTLGCLEKFEIDKVPTACIEDLEIRTLKDLASRKELLKKQISEIEEHLKKIDETEKAYEEFKDIFGGEISRAGQYFQEQRYEDAMRVLEALESSIEDLEKMIRSCNPDKYRYSWS